MKKSILNLIIVCTLVIIVSFSMITEKVQAATNVSYGAWLGTWASQSSQNIESYSAVVGKSPTVVQTFVNTNQVFSVWSPVMNYVDSKGAINLITIEPKKANGIDYNTNEINKGLLDPYFITLAKQMASWNGGKTIWVRFMHEVNGNWYGWSIGDSSVNTNKSYINAYRRVVDIFRKNKAYNVKFIYNINSDNVGRNSSYMGAYPGDTYVDYVSIDGYNFGTTQWYSSWKSFNDIFKNSYAALTKGSTKPVIIAEYASTEIGGDKAAWIKDSFNQIKSTAYSRLVAAVWFNENKETDWRVNSSTASLQAYMNNIN